MEFIRNILTPIILTGAINLTWGQAIYNDLVKIRFVQEYESHAVGYLDPGSEKPAFDPVPSNYNRDSIITIIKKELDKYPIEVIRKADLRELVICDGVYFNDKNGIPVIKMNGTYILPVETGNVLFLDGNFTGLPKTLHHEFSSLLFLQLCDTDLNFREKYLTAMQYFTSVTSYLVDNPNWERGDFDIPRNTDNRLVLRNDGYALTDFENDYNSIASSLFSPNNVQRLGQQLVDNNQKLWDFLNKAKRDGYPIFKKVMIIVDLYNYVDSGLTLGYFESMETN